MDKKLNFDDLKILANDVNISYKQLRKEMKTKNDDDVQQLVDQIYKTKVEHHLVRCPSTAVEKSEIRHMLEEMHK